MNHDEQIIEFINDNYKEISSICLKALIEARFNLSKDQAISTIKRIQSSQPMRFSQEVTEYLKLIF